MALSKEEKEQLEALTRKSKEPDGPRGNINFTLDLGSDAAWERARKLGLIPSEDDKDADDEDDEPDDVPNRKRGYFGG